MDRPSCTKTASTTAKSNVCPILLDIVETKPLFINRYKERSASSRTGWTGSGVGSPSQRVFTEQKRDN